MTDPIGGISTATVRTPTAPTDQMGKDTFLKLLVAQLKYQNPDSPADSSQFLAQTAQFTSVEKLSELSANITALLAVQQSLAGASLLGRAVTWSDAGTTRTGEVTAVRQTAAGPVLAVSAGGSSHAVALGAVSEITQANPSTTGPTSTSPTSTTGPTSTSATPPTASPEQGA